MTKQTVNCAIVCVPVDWAPHSTDTSEHVGTAVCCVAYRTRVPVIVLSLMDAKRRRRGSRFRGMHVSVRFNDVESAPPSIYLFIFCFFYRFVNFRRRRRTTLFASSCSNGLTDFSKHNLFIPVGLLEKKTK